MHLSETELKTWTQRLADLVAKETAVFRQSRRLPFGVPIPADMIKLPEVASLASGAVQLLAEGTPALVARVDRRLNDWFIVVTGASDEGQEASRVVSPRMVSGRPCLTKEDMRKIASHIKMTQTGEVPGLYASPSDEWLGKAVQEVFDAKYFGLLVDENAFQLTLTEIRRMVEQNTLLQIYGLEEGFR